MVKKVKVAHTRLPSVGSQSWSRFLAVSLQVKWIINPTVGCHYFPPGLQLPPQPLRGLLPVLLLGEQRHDGCEQFAEDCYLTASRLRFEPGPFCAWVQHANHSATEPCTLSSRCSINCWYAMMWCWCVARRGESSAATAASRQVDRLHCRHTDLRPTRLALQDHSPGGAGAESR